MSESTIADPAASKKRRRRGAIVTTTATLVIAWFTLRPSPVELLANPTDTFLVADFLLNVILFVPLGAGLALLGAGPVAGLAIGGAASALIEGCQLFWLSNRDASVHDVVANAAGALLGALLVAQWDRRSRWWRWGGPSIAALALSAWLLGVSRLAPSLAPAGRWWGQWAHVLGGTVPFTGAVRSFTFHGVPIPDGPVGQWRALRTSATAAESVTLAAAVVTGAPFSGRAQLVGLVTEHGAELAGLWQEGDTLLARWRLGLADATLRTPLVRLAGALPPGAGDTVQLQFTVTRRALRLVSRHRHGEVAVTIPLAPELAWTGLIPFEYGLDGSMPRLPLVGLCLLFALVGAGLSRHPVAGLLAVALGLGAGPLWLGTAAPGVTAMLTASVAALGGILLGRRLRL